MLICPLHLNTFDLETGCSLTGQPDLRVYAVSVDADNRLVINAEVHAT